MSDMVKSFQKLTPELLPLAGGKGGMLARMYQDGYPVPTGIVIMQSAFHGEQLADETWRDIQDYLRVIRKNGEVLFAVRSSALSEDSAHASYAGEFASVLNVKTDEEILEAIYTVYKSRLADRVKLYSTIQGIKEPHKMAVVIQQMIQSEISGVLFTADPITGSRISMAGNFVYGLGEQLVSGEVNACSFKLIRPTGKYNGPAGLKKHAVELFKCATNLEAQYGCPQDIEWAVAKGKLYILQSRPITTLSPGNPDTYEWNDSLSGDFLWVNTNIGEAMPEVLTPLTWALARALDNEINIVPGYYSLSGNICGRAYTNVNMSLSILSAFGVSIKRGLSIMTITFGRIPEEISIPVYPFSQLSLLKVIIPRLARLVPKFLTASRNINQYLHGTPEWCQSMTTRIREVKTKEKLATLWRKEIHPYNVRAFITLLTCGSKIGSYVKLSKELTQLLGAEDANTLMSNFRGNSELASLGPVIGLSRIIKGEMTREDYLIQYGHRGPNEFELSIPYQGEEPGWLDKQIEELKDINTDVEGLLNRQSAQYQGAWERFMERHPAKVKRIEKQIGKVSEVVRLREALRSEFIRVVKVDRAFALKVGELTGLGDRVFFLYIDEMLNILGGDDSVVKDIPARVKTYNKYKSLPPLPSIIRGRFTPFKWALDPNRRIDKYDSTAPITIPDSETINGFAGAAGRIQGTVRVLKNSAEGEQLQPGEILVTSTTNVGWTSLFLKTAAIITDIGAPLSHAAIVARELGIPAVVGCGSATSRLKTGDRVIVDGGKGVVQILD